MLSSVTSAPDYDGGAVSNGKSPHKNPEDKEHAADAAAFGPDHGFLMKHLASMSIATSAMRDPKPEDRLRSLKKGHPGSGIGVQSVGMPQFSTQNTDMRMWISNKGALLRKPIDDGLLAAYPIETIHKIGFILKDEDFGDIFAFITRKLESNVVHLFQVHFNDPHQA